MSTGAPSSGSLPRAASPSRSASARDAASAGGGRVPLIGRLSEGGPGEYTVFRAAMRGHGYPDVRIDERYVGTVPRSLLLQAELLVD
jgi:hypothetical protein